MGEGEKNSGRSFFEWFRDPGSWIALIAALLSVFTFVMVYAYQGSITVLLPHSVGIGEEVAAPGLNLIVPATFSNNGAPRTRRHIRYIDGRVRSLDKSTPLDGVIEWSVESKFLGKREFLQKYPDTEDKEEQDYLEYVGRGVPFSLAGGESASKVLVLNMAGVRLAVAPAQLQVEVILHTDDGEFKDTVTYQCPGSPSNGLHDGKAIWCKGVSNR